MAKQKAVLFGMNPPFIGGPQKILSRQEDEILVKNDVLQLLSTVPGERVMRPNWGVPLRTFLFEQAVDSDISALSSTIAQSLETQDPRIIVREVSISRDDDRNGMTIRVVFALKKQPQQELTVERFLAQET